MRLGQSGFLMLALIALPVIASPMYPGAGIVEGGALQPGASDAPESNNNSIISGLIDFSESSALRMPSSFGTIAPTLKVPEAGTLALVGIGLVAIGLFSRRRRP